MLFCISAAWQPLSALCIPGPVNMCSFWRHRSLNVGYKYVLKQMETHCCAFSSSPYSQPSFSSWMSRVMMSPSSKLRSVSLLPAVWGKMVLTRVFLLTFRPDDCDVDLDRLPSPILPWSGGRRDQKFDILENGQLLFLASFCTYSTNKCDMREM